MVIQKRKRFREFFKKYGAAIGVVVLVLALTVTGLTVGLVGTSNPDKEVSGGPLVFHAPMANADVLKDFSDVELQENTTLNEWNAHLSMDLFSQDGQVYAVLGGTVLDVAYNYMTGHTVTLQHDDGFVSIYSSLDESVLVAKNDKIEAGQLIGTISTSASDEENDGPHLHFTLKQNDKKVDPNQYIEFEKK